MKRALWLGLASVVVAACSSTSGGGGTTPGGAPQPETLKEAEPNNGPDVAGMQDIGPFDKARTVVITGKLETGGNDGTKYTGDYDGFAFDVAASGGTMEGKIEWTGDADVDAVIYDASLNPVGGDTAAMKPITNTAKIPKGRFAVVLFSKDKPADYTMTLTYTVPVTGAGGTCESPLQPENVESGCKFELVEPANGAQLTMPARFGFKSLGCETTIKMHIFGNPPTPENSFNYGFLRGTQTIYEWLIKSREITADDLASLKSDNGVYHWQMESWYHSKSEARTFTVAPAVCK